MAQVDTVTPYQANTLIYVLVLGWPVRPFTVQSLGLSAATRPGKIGKVELLGTDQKVTWNQQNDTLSVELPSRYKPAVDYAAVLKLTMG